MNTVTFNISLPQTLANQVDAQIASGEFASRSEFFRTLVRLYETVIQKKTAPLEIIPFKKRPLKEIEQSMLATGQYDRKFVKSIIRGLAKSSVYANS